MNAVASAMLDKMLNEQRRQNERATKVSCTKECAQWQYDFLKGWAKKKPIVKFGDESSTFWKSGKWMTKIPPQDIVGMVKHGLAVRDGNRLILK